MDTNITREDCIQVLVGQNNDLAVSIINQLESLTGSLGKVESSKPDLEATTRSIVDGIIDNLGMLRRRLQTASELLTSSLVPKVGK